MTTMTKIHQPPNTLPVRPVRITEALPESMVIFPDQVTEDTWHLFIENARRQAWCPTCGGKGCNGSIKPCPACPACQGRGVKE